VIAGAGGTGRVFGELTGGGGTGRVFGDDSGGGGKGRSFAAAAPVAVNAPTKTIATRILFIVPPQSRRRHLAVEGHSA